MSRSLELTVTVHGETRILASVHSAWKDAVHAAVRRHRVWGHKYSVVKSPNGTDNWLVVH